MYTFIGHLTEAVFVNSLTLPFPSRSKKYSFPVYSFSTACLLVARLTFHLSINRFNNPWSTRAQAYLTPFPTLASFIFISKDDKEYYDIGLSKGRLFTIWKRGLPAFPGFEKLDYNFPISPVVVQNIQSDLNHQPHLTLSSTTPTYTNPTNRSSP